MEDNKSRLQTYMDDLNIHLNKEKSFQNTNELVKRIYSQKKQLTEKLTTHGLALSKAAERDEEPAKGNANSSKQNNRSSP